MAARLLALLLSAVLASCAFQSYEAKPAPSAGDVARFDSRRIDESGLREFMAERGDAQPEWPIREWRLLELTLLALYYHPDIQVARERVEVARAATVTAGRRPNPGLVSSAASHSLRPNDESPWTVGLQLELPIVTAGKREARTERAQVGLEIARLDLADAAWRVRSRLRSRWLDYVAAARAAELAETELGVRNELVGLLRARLAAGAASAVEVANEEVRRAETERQFEHQSGLAEVARSGLADALGLPVGAIARMTIALPDERSVSPIEAPETAREYALRNRLDVRRALLGYASAEADLKLEIARQYPDFTLRPGYSWDQGDRIWSLALGLLLPVVDRNEGAILEAKARRELAGQEFLALQARVIGEVEGALAGFRRARAELELAERLRETAGQRDADAEARFAAGYVDRVQRASARLELASAQRAALESFGAAERAQGRLEDALQRPLDR